MAAGEDDRHDLLMAKVTALLLLFFVTIIMSAVPYMLNKCFKWTTANRESARTTLTIQCLLHFGGGVLLCTTFIYFLPEVEELCEELTHCGIVPPLSIPLPTTLMCAGFFLMYLIEECVHACFHNSKSKKSDNKKDNGRTEDSSSNITAITEDSNSNSTVALSIDNLEVNHTTSPLESPKAKTHSHMPTSEDLEEATITASVRGALLVLALSIHEVFEGVAIGLEDSTSSVWFLFTAISVHKLVLAFCVGMELLVSRIKPLISITYLLIYALVTPTGVLIGLAITGNNGTVGPSLVSTILQGIACGTLVYVVFFEVISTKHLGFTSFFSLVLGFCLMLAMVTFSEKEDDSADIDCYLPTGTNAVILPRSRHLHF